MVPEYRAARFTALLAARLESLPLAGPVQRMELTAGRLRRFLATSGGLWAPGEQGGHEGIVGEQGTPVGVDDGDPGGLDPEIPRRVGGEEAGLLGAKAFFARDAAARRLGLVINLEARGGAGRTMMFETSAGNGALVAAGGRTESRSNCKTPMGTSFGHLVVEQRVSTTDA